MFHAHTFLCAPWIPKSVDNVNKQKLCLVNFNCYPLHTLLILDKYEKRKEGTKQFKPSFTTMTPTEYGVGMQVCVMLGNFFPRARFPDSLSWISRGIEDFILFFFTTHHAPLLRSCTLIERTVRVLCRYQIA